MCEGILKRLPLALLPLPSPLVYTLSMTFFMWHYLTINYAILHVLFQENFHFLPSIILIIIKHIKFNQI